MIELDELNFRSISDIINSDGFKKYIKSYHEKNNQLSGIDLLINRCKDGIPKDRISMIVGQFGVGKSYLDLIPDYINYILRLKKLQKIQNNIKK